MANTPKTDAEKVAALEAEGLTTSDAQAAVDAEAIPEKPRPRRGQKRSPAEKVAAGKAKRDAEPKAKKEPAERAACLCGCGGTPKGKRARYCPGHDARHHAALRAAGQKVTLLAAKRGGAG